MQIEQFNFYQSREVREDNKKPRESLAGSNILLRGPELISPEELENKEKDLVFTFKFRDRGYYFGYKNNKPFLKIEIFDKLPEELRVKGKFKEEKIIEDNKEKTVYIFEYGETLAEQKPSLVKYHIFKPRDFFKKKEKVPQPQEITVQQLIEIMKNRKVLFYTGAGISRESGIYDMEQLTKALGVFQEDFVQRVVESPENIVSVWTQFVESCYQKLPTPAHYALSELAKQFNVQVFTENVDYLQEKTGIKPVHVSAFWLEKNIRPEWLQDIDAIITIGLNRDDRGFLGWYKANNPQGKIIAINFQQPPYLGDEDFILKGDCQKVLPEIVKIIR